MNIHTVHTLIRAFNATSRNHCHIYHNDRLGTKTGSPPPKSHLTLGSLGPTGIALSPRADVSSVVQDSGTPTVAIRAQNV